MDFIIQLPELISYKNIMIITNHLKKGFIIMPIKQINIKTVVEIFLDHFVWNHGLPDAIISDRGRVFVEGLWKCLYQLLKITRRLSTAFHPETNGLTEQVNTEI